jgi:hypothetical protein
MADVSLGKVYKLFVSGDDRCYIGSTTSPLKTRLIHHKSKGNYCSSRILFENKADVQIELLEAVNFTDKVELHKRELEWIKNTPNCINIGTPCKMPGLGEATLANYAANYDRVVARIGKKDFTAEEAIAFVKKSFSNLGTKNCYLSALKHYAKDEDKAKYQAETKHDMPALQEQQNSQTLPAKKLENLLTWAEIEKAYEDAEALYKQGKFTLENLVVLGLYCLNDPVRLDYANMSFLKVNPNSDEFVNNITQNYCWLGEQPVFIFNHYKTAKKFGTNKRISIPYELAKLLRIYKDQGVEYVFDGNANSLGKRINTILTKLTGKKCTLNLVRHARITKFYEGNPSIAEKDALAQRMLHGYTEGERYRLIPSTLRSV